MEIRVYSQDLKLIGVSENQLSCTWTRKYNEVGKFEIHLPITSDNVALYQRNNIVWLYGAYEAGVIEAIKYNQTNKVNKMVVTGRFLESYLDRRVIQSVFNFSGKTEVAMRQIMSDANLPNIILGDLKGFSETISFQTSWKSRLTIMQKIAAASSLGFRIKPNFAKRQLSFEVFKGLKRTRSQHERNFVEFSDEFNNLDTSTYNINGQLEKNVAYVLGEGEGTDRKVVVVGNDTLTGLARKELYVDARDLQSTDLTDKEYEALLRQRGEEKLSENTLSTSFECDTIALGNFKYMIDYDLGDIVTVKKNAWGLSSELRITEIMEVYEHEVMKVVPTLGNPLPTTLDLED